MNDVERIKDRLRACKNADEVAAVADEEREAVKSLIVHDKTMAIQISNLKAYVLKMLAE